MKKILCVDDEPAVLRCLADALTSRGYRVLAAQTPDEGLRLLREDHAIDLLLLDIRMPGMNGFDVYRNVRTFSRVPVLFVTAYARTSTPSSERMPDTWAKYLTDGVTDVMFKPFDLQTFFDKVEALLDKAEQRPPNAS